MSTGHVFTVASGFGLRVIASRTPYRFRRTGEAGALTVECQYDGGWHSALVTPARGGFESKLDARTAQLADVADIEVGPADEEWWIETSLYRLPLPQAWSVYATGESATQVMFDLLGPGDSDLFLRVPRRMPSLESL